MAAAVKRVVVPDAAEHEISRSTTLLPGLRRLKRCRSPESHTGTDGLLLLAYAGIIGALDIVRLCVRDDTKGRRIAI